MQQNKNISNKEAPEITLSKSHLACIRRQRHRPHENCGIAVFQSHILAWYKKNKRDGLPWRFTAKRHVGAYEILVSEIMLQQTQVSRTLDAFPRFLKEFPSVSHLAAAPLDSVLKQWQGMGYNRRALYLKKCAEAAVERFNGQIPSNPVLLMTLPGIGPYTAGAVASFAFNKPTVFMDTNIRKFFIHYFFSDSQDRKIPDSEIFPIAERILYTKNPRLWNYALMDYGALMLSRKPGLLAKAKTYHKQSRFLGSTRFFRSQIVQYLLKHGRASYNDLQKTSPQDIRPILASLCKEGLIYEAHKDTFAVTK